MEATEQEVKAHAESRLATLRAILDSRDPDMPGATLDEDGRADRLAEFPLNVEERRLVVVLIGTGGPHDEFRMEYLPQDDRPCRVSYRFMDWDGSREVILDSEDAATVEDAFGWMVSPC